MTQEVRSKLLSFMERSEKSQRQVAEEIGVSPTTISQFLNGTYPGDRKRMAETIDKYLSIAEERLNNVCGSTFYEGLGNFRKVIAAAKYAHKHCEIVLVRGDAGAGKTTALRHYTEQNAGVIFVTANSCMKTATAVLRKIAFQTGRQVRGSKEQLMDSMISYLSGTSRLIIIDEADHLTLDALQTVRNLNDQAHVGVLLAGNNKLFNQMVTGPRGYEFDQLRTRIFLKPKVRNEYSIEEIQHIFPNCDKPLLKLLLKTADQESLREAHKLYEFGLECAQGQNAKLTAEFLKTVMESI